MKNYKKYFKILLILLSVSATFSVFSIEADTISVNEPDLMSSIYHSFSRNYLGTVATGMGYTGVAKYEGMGNVLINPATLDLVKHQAYCEFIVKPPVNELDQIQKQIYESSYAGMFGFGFQSEGILDNYSILLSTPKSIQYSSFTRRLKTDDVLIRKPEFIQNDLVLSSNRKFGSAIIGLSLIGTLYTLREYRLEGTYQNIDMNEVVFNVQPGLILDTETFSWGVSALMPQKFTMKNDFKSYDCKIPMEITTGLNLRRYDANYSIEYNFQNTKYQNYNFKDRHCCRIGAERNFETYSLRCGLNYSTSIFSGDIFPDLNAVNATYEDELPAKRTLVENGQMLLSVGGTFKINKFGNFSFSLLTDLKGDAPVTQLSTSLELYLSIFKRKMRDN